MPKYILFFILFPGILMAQTKSIDQAGIELLKERIRTVTARTSSISSEFIQVKEMAMLNEKITSKGRFYFKREKKLRWEYTSPYSYIIVFTNDMITVKSDDQVSRFNLQSNKVFREINRIILGSIQGTLLMDDLNFKASYNESKDNYIVRLQPLAQQIRESLAGIVIWFNRADLTVNRLELLEPGGDVTAIRFVNQSINQPVGDEKFEVD
jgi:outer membrane lipoprotein-sorting protein